LPQCPVCDSLYIRILYRGEVNEGRCSECLSEWKQNLEGTDHWAIMPEQDHGSEQPPEHR